MIEKNSDVNLFKKLPDARLARNVKVELTPSSMMTSHDECNAADGAFRTDSALVVLSGGQDSTTCLFWSFDKFSIASKNQRQEKIKTITFDYGQKHKIEIESARKICDLAGVDFDLVKIPEILRSSSPLVNKDSELEKYESVKEFKPGVEATFVPGRNILFLTIAANIAVHHRVQNIVIGVCEEDFGGYYDCREKFIKDMERALNQGLFGEDHGLSIHTPLMHLNKAESVKLIKSFGSLENECLEALSYSHTCYAGAFPPCGKCHACLLRERGFKEAGIADPLLART